MASNRSMQEENEKTIYKTDRGTTAVYMGLLGIGWGVAIWSGISNGASIFDPRIFFGILVWIVLTIEMFFGLYGEFDKTNSIFSRVNYLGLRRKNLKLDEIREIRYQPIFWISSYDRSIFVVGIHHGRQVNLYYFSNRNFSEKTLAKMAHDLKVAAPHIKYDSPAEALVKKYFPT